MAGATKAKAKEPEKPEALPQVTPANYPIELLREAQELIAEISPQNEHIRDWLRRTDALLTKPD